MEEFTDRKGDRWVVRECGDSDDHCVVVERHMRMRDCEMRHHSDFHIPLESLGDLIEALRTFDKNP